MLCGAPAVPATACRTSLVAVAGSASRKGGAFVKAGRRLSRWADGQAVGRSWCGKHNCHRTKAYHHHYHHHHHHHHHHTFQTFILNFSHVDNPICETSTLTRARRPWLQYVSLLWPAGQSLQGCELKVWEFGERHVLCANALEAEWRRMLGWLAELTARTFQPASAAC